MNAMIKNCREVGSALHLKSPKDNQHPVGKKSNRISIEVDEHIKLFTDFQVNLKHLSTLYRTEHELTKSLNENGIYMAKCYQKMLADSPLQDIVASTKDMDESPKTKHLDPERSDDLAAVIVKDVDSKDYSKDYVQGEFVSAVGVSKCARVDDDHDGHESYLRKIEPEEVMEAQDNSFIKEANQSSFVANNDKQRMKILGKDPPSKDSLVELNDKTHDETSSSKDSIIEKDKEEERKSDSEFPNDEEPGDKFNSGNVNLQSEGVNVMVDVVDDNDSFTKDIVDDDDTYDVGSNLREANSAKDSHTGEVNERRSMDPDEEVGEPDSGETSDVEHVENREDKKPDPNKIAAENNDKELEMWNKCTSVNKQKEASYFDVHKHLYKETNSYLKNHSKLVDYVEDWEKTVTTRVQSMLSEYQKLRKGLNHYIGKVDALECEKRKSEEKHREIPPKRLEKLERNRIKLMDTRKSHDAAGIDLIILIDEIVHRSWRDAFLLLQKSVTYEIDFSSMQANVYGSLGATARKLNQAWAKESISSSHRLLSLASSSPEEINFHKFKGDWDGFEV